VTDGSSPLVGRICVYVDPRYPPYAGLIRQVIVSADESGIELFAARCCMEALSEFGIMEGEDCQAALVLGGDGTILRGLKYFGKNKVPVLGINTGHLGFLASADMKNIRETLGSLSSGSYRIERYPLLKGETSSGQILTATNDFSINRSILAGILHFDLFLDQDLVASIAGDGVVISTPLGSTAYGLSCGGPILDPALPAMLVVPICAHQLSLRPLVVPESMTVTVTISQLRGAAPFISSDGKLEVSLSAGEYLKVTRGDGYSSVIQTRGRGSHYSHLGRKLGWGIRGDKSADQSQS